MLREYGAYSVRRRARWRQAVTVLRGELAA
jgi:hypothetical protein